jgi:hypothetical protein
MNDTGNLIQAWTPYVGQDLFGKGHRQIDPFRYFRQTMGKKTSE